MTDTNKSAGTVIGEMTCEINIDTSAWDAYMANLKEAARLHNELAKSPFAAVFTQLASGNISDRDLVTQSCGIKSTYHDYNLPRTDEIGSVSFRPHAFSYRSNPPQYRLTLYLSSGEVRSCTVERRADSLVEIRQLMRDRGLDIEPGSELWVIGWACVEARGGES